MPGPQLEDGYTRIAHEILEQVAKRKFNGTQFAIILFIWRYTYGFSRKSHTMSIEFISEGIEKDAKQVKRELKNLLERKVLLVTKEACGVRPRTISFNKNFIQWLEGAKLPPQASKARGVENAPALGSNLPPLEGANPPPKIVKKKTLKKVEIRDMDITPEKIKFLDTVFLTQDQHGRLIKDFGRDTVDLYIAMVDEWQTNNPKKARVDHNKTIRVWIRKDQAKNPIKTKQQRNQDEMNILNEFYEEGAARETNGDSKLPSSDQDRLSLF